MAGRGEVDNVVKEIDEILGIFRSKRVCQIGAQERYFPLVVHPLETDSRVWRALSDFGCSSETIASINNKMKNGIDSSYGVRPLPARR